MSSKLTTNEVRKLKRLLALEGDREAQRRARLVEALASHQRVYLTRQQLENMKDEALEGLARSVPVTTNAERVSEPPPVVLADPDGE